MHTNAIEHPETFSIGTTFEMFVDQMFEFTVHNVVFVFFYPVTCVWLFVFVFVHSMHCGILVLWAFYVLMSLAWWILSEFKFKFFVVTFVLFLSEVCNVRVRAQTDDLYRFRLW